jgi:hypothetical protein
MPLRIVRELGDLYLIILKYYPGATLANQKANPEYQIGHCHIKLEFATALNVRTQVQYRDFHFHILIKEVTLNSG